MRRGAYKMKYGISTPKMNFYISSGTGKKEIDNYFIKLMIRDTIVSDVSKNLSRSVNLLVRSISNSVLKAGTLNGRE